ncbi:MAG: hypothetical protein JSU63_02925 [Phycisphaerales bacterium]|nr:MAG: hypothetical protein JSU63_02925 [Phycisphaerales bacterium]
MPQAGLQGSFNPAMFVVIAVGIFTLTALLIGRGNRRQRRILWWAFVIACAMVLRPPWLGIRGEWVRTPGEPGRQDTQYEQSIVSIGYGFIWSPPRPAYLLAWESPRINWARLFIQLGTVGVGVSMPVFHVRTRRIPVEATPETTGEAGE